MAVLTCLQVDVEDMVSHVLAAALSAADRTGASAFSLVAMGWIHIAALRSARRWRPSEAGNGFTAAAPDLRRRAGSR